jgi:hypothetical protein
MRSRFHRYVAAPHFELQYLREFLKKFETALMVVYSGAWGKLIHGKNLKSKSCGTVPLSFDVDLFYQLTVQ